MERLDDRPPTRSRCKDIARAALEQNLRKFPPLARVEIALRLRLRDAEFQRRLRSAAVLGL